MVNLHLKNIFMNIIIIYKKLKKFVNYKKMKKKMNILIILCLNLTQ